jgi:hypothetical protein
MGFGIVDHATEALARRTLVAAATLDLGPHPLQPVEELIPDRFQLAQVRYARSRPGKRLRRSLRDARLGCLLRIRRQQRLQPSDLTPQGTAGRPSLLLAGSSEGGLGIGRRGRLPHKRLVGGRSGVEGAGEVAWIDSERARSLGRIGGHLLQSGRRGDVGQDEGPLSVARHDQPLVLQSTVDRPGGVDIDPGSDSQFTHTGELVPASEPATEDQRPQPPGQVYADWKVAVALDIRRRILHRGRVPRSLLRGLYHCASTLAHLLAAKAAKTERLIPARAPKSKQLGKGEGRGGENRAVPSGRARKASSSGEAGRAAKRAH